MGKLEEFARTVMQTALEGSDMDGGEIQELALKCGLIKGVPFDPKKHHGPGSEYFEPGDQWFVFDGHLRSIGSRRGAA
jgi:hypothetical protein